MNTSKKITSLLKEPLLHFLLIGAALFLVYGWRSDPAPVSGGQAGGSAEQIVLSWNGIEQINSQFVKIWQRPPTEEEQQELIEDFVRNEIYYREAVTIGLDRDDEVLKRRLRQKMEFIYEDINALAEPTDEDLMAFMQKHREKYLTDPQIAFRQVGVSEYKRGKRAETDARRFLEQLTAGADPDSVGDAMLLEPEVALSPLWEIKKQFGDEFGRSVLEITPGMWAGPIHSGFGLHLVYVEERQEIRLPDLAEVRETVKRDWLVEKQKEMKDAAYAKIRKRYSVSVERQKTVAPPVTTAANTEGSTR